MSPCVHRCRLLCLGVHGRRSSHDEHHTDPSITRGPRTFVYPMMSITHVRIEVAYDGSDLSQEAGHHYFEGLQPFLCIPNAFKDRFEDFSPLRRGHDVELLDHVGHMLRPITDVHPTCRPDLNEALSCKPSNSRLGRVDCNMMLSPELPVRRQTSAWTVLGAFDDLRLELFSEPLAREALALIRHELSLPNCLETGVDMQRPAHLLS